MIREVKTYSVESCVILRYDIAFSSPKGKERLSVVIKIDSSRSTMKIRKGAREALRSVFTERSGIENTLVRLPPVPDVITKYINWHTGKLEKR